MCSDPNKDRSITEHNLVFPLPKYISTIPYTIQVEYFKRSNQ